MKRAQISFEYLYLVGTVLILLSVGYSYFSSISIDYANQEFVEDIVRNLKSVSDEVYSLGYPNKRVLSLYFPKNIDYQNSFVTNKTIQVSYVVENVSKNIFRLVNYNVSGTLPSTAGQYLFNVSVQKNGTVFIVLS